MANPKNSQRPVDAAKSASSAISTRSNVTPPEVAAGDERQVAMSDDEHERRADHRVEEELRGRVHAVLVAPPADQEVHRHEHDLEEHEEQEQVEAEERAHHAGLEQQQPREVRLVLRRRGAGRCRRSRAGTAPRSARSGTARCRRRRGASEMPHCSIHGCFDTNWNPASAVSNSTRAARRSAPRWRPTNTSATQLGELGRDFEVSSDRRSTPTIGSSTISVDRSGNAEARVGPAAANIRGSPRTITNQPSSSTTPMPMTPA